MALKSTTALQYLEDTSRMEHHLAGHSFKTKSEKIEHLENAIALDKAIVVLMKIK